MPNRRPVPLKHTHSLRATGPGEGNAMNKNPNLQNTPPGSGVILATPLPARSGPNLKVVCSSAGIPAHTNISASCWCLPKKLRKEQFSKCPPPTPPPEILHEYAQKCANLRTLPGRQIICRKGMFHRPAGLTKPGPKTGINNRPGYKTAPACPAPAQPTQQHRTKPPHKLRHKWVQKFAPVTLTTFCMLTSFTIGFVVVSAIPPSI